MNRMQRLALCALCAAGCFAPSPAPREPVTAARAVTLPHAAHEGPTSPLEATWVVVSADDTRTVLRARVTRRGVLALPMTLSVTLPTGVSLVRGTTQITLPPTTDAATVEHEFELRHAGLPPDDVVLRVDGDDVDVGVHARVPYRFGRQEPTGPRPAPAGATFAWGGRDYGRPVPAGQ